LGVPLVPRCDDLPSISGLAVITFSVACPVPRALGGEA
jgi:hypothetical protein